MPRGRFTPYVRDYPIPRPITRDATLAAIARGDYHAAAGGNMRLCVAPATRFAVRGVLEFNDAMQAGYTGLFNAASNFDASRGVQFSTYASYWVRQAMRREEMGGLLLSVPAYAFE
ncbi:MAG: hypothetical protein H0W42_12485, partial [Gemmatimonadaceae bacterium]|nr:hypothetical protein [Gemmatimonadaceae bacterium]